ncbi:MAG TPA: 2-hydroxyacid dehydrogenase [Polyangiaceae bacterium]|nr:2-hydroxyacid dehydrogenase [Polyangiaceae bacterium]
MKMAMFDTHAYDRTAFEAANAAFGHAITFFDLRLTEDTAPLARGHDCVCCFVADRLNADALEALHRDGVRLVALRCAGYNNVDLVTAARLGLPVVRVPEYSPHAVAEHAVGLVLALNRKIHRAYARVREWNFSLDGLVGFDLYGKTVGIVGTGRIGLATARIFRGFGCRVLAFDLHPALDAARALELEYVELPTLFSESDVISLHVPLTPATYHMIDAAALASMKPGVFLINTGRGALIDSSALIQALKRGSIGAAGLDVYEEEEGIFFEDLSNRVLQDDVLARLLTFPNVVVTSHQAFLTREALGNIATTTLENVSAFERGLPLMNQVRAEDVLRPSAPA